MTVKRLLSEIDSEELSEWYAFDQRWPLPDPWWQTARICRTIMAASGNYRRLPEEKVLVPAQVKPHQTQADIIAELAKLKDG